MEIPLSFDVHVSIVFKYVSNISMIQWRLVISEKIIVVIKPLKIYTK